MGSAKDRGVRTSHGGPSTASSSDEAGQSTSASIAEESIRRDLEDESAVDAELRNTEGSTSKPALGQHSLATGRRGSSNVAASSQSLLPIPPVAELAVQAERSPEAVIEEERTLLRDNKLLPDSTQPGTGEATETTALLNASNTEAGYGAETTAEAIDKAWEDAVLSGQIQTTWQREAKVVASYSSRLMLTYFLQQSLTLTTIFTAGRLGKNELAAVSLGSMTAVITGYSVYYGLTTSLDTLCAQAYGRGNKKLVGLYMQRMVYFSWLCTIPIAVVWYASPYILAKLVPEKEIAMLSGRYLRVLIFGAPAFACFESSKRYVQAQGRFNATLCVLLFISPLNVLLQYIFVWVSCQTIAPHRLFIGSSDFNRNWNWASLEVLWPLPLRRISCRSACLLTFNSLAAKNVGLAFPERPSRTGVLVSSADHFNLRSNRPCTDVL